MVEHRTLNPQVVGSIPTGGTTHRKIMKEKLLEALLSHYKAQKDEAIAVIDLYLKKSVGIGDHSNILDELKKWTTKLSEAQENLLVLEKYFIEE